MHGQTNIKFGKSDYNIRHVSPSVSSKQLGSHCMDLHEIWYLRIFQKLIEKIQVSIKTRRMTGTLHEDLCTFVITSRSVLLRMRNIANKSRRENQNTNFRLNNFFSENRAVYEVMWYNRVEIEPTADNRIRATRFECWIIKTTDAHSRVFNTYCFP